MVRGDAREEVLLPAALKLFARHGVSGTSLQMIADELGVSKAAVYHHHHTKESIVLAVLWPAFEQVAALVERVGSLPAGGARRRALVEGLAEQAVTHRQLYAVMLRDVAVPALVASEPRLAAPFAVLRRELQPDHEPATAPLRVAMFLAGLVAPAGDPEIAQLSDEQLRRGIVDVGERLLDLG
ncbi:DNA-binding transcriptional regulator, AcrR family [Propionibacterium cyclohexanicum]|uniref:DNA-binding transcriptional regulator, AcrR family n=1 Tax=Propionibacterium cyclohexanicum TaxID=64702 RepID=A0A1H9SQL3_9ACTN|nr:TetR/AcrR family transcriptional regulator [Propionibacterium cyclohexanicum]SER87256.1 DNA-binding transcriptional regulator, AcrR family [Propionibacterium cyclohexanicum]